MSEHTAIQWTDHTWNPWVGCRKVSPGCANCYAESLMQRFGRDFSKRTRTKDWRKPVLWNKRPWICDHCGYSASEELSNCPMCDADLVGFHRRCVFPSLCDWLDPEVPIQWLADFLELVRTTPNLTWQLLTKRPELFVDQLFRSKERCHRNARPWFDEWLSGNRPENIWLGVSIEDQKRADERIPELLKIPARVRFLSCEPLLAPVNLESPKLLPLYTEKGPAGHGAGIDWVIVGGESGPKARPCNADWIRDIVRQCQDAKVPVFVKQLGAHIIDYQCVSANRVPDSQCWPVTARGDEAQRRIYLNHPKGGDPEEWPPDLRIREMPKLSH